MTFPKITFSPLRPPHNNNKSSGYPVNNASIIDQYVQTSMLRLYIIMQLVNGGFIQNV